jgi:hypothetical protein
MHASATDVLGEHGDPGSVRHELHILQAVGWPFIQDIATL